MHRVLIHAVFETAISQDDPAYAQSVAEMLFADDVTNRLEMFSVKVERVEVEPLGKPASTSPEC